MNCVAKNLSLSLLYNTNNCMKIITINYLTKLITNEWMIVLHFGRLNRLE